MTFDGIVMAAVVAELRELAEGARVDSVYQPGKLDVLIVARRSGRSIGIIASAEASCARAHVTTVDRENPQAPPAFCMLLRKHLVGARIVRLEQRDLDRVLEIGFVGPYDEPPRTLVVEVMGRHSNIILVDDRSGLVLDSIKHIGPAQSRVRVVRPGTKYAPPPPQDRLNPLQTSASEFSEALERFARDHPELPPEEFLTRAFTGLGRDSAGVIVSRACLVPRGMETDKAASTGVAQRISGLAPDGVARLWEEFSRAMASVREGRFSPCAGVDRETGAVAWISVIGAPAEAPAEEAGLEERVDFPTAGALLDYAFTPRERTLTLSAASQDMLRAVSTAADRLRRKLAVQEEEIREAGRADEFRRAGELITANAQIIASGQPKAEVVDYFDPELRLVEVDLDPRLSPHENAQEYFKKYARAKRRLAVAREQADLTRAELEYLEQVAVTIEQAESLEAIEQIRRELADQGYLSHPKRERPGARRREPRSVAGPLRFDVEGIEVLVGRNNTENDFLTLRMARPNDVWLHARGVPGAHVVLRVGPEEPQRVSDSVLLRAAEIAAYYSKARSASKVAVDYTLRKHVRKPKGARPGMVIYDHEKTIVAAPRPPRGNDA